MSEDELRAMAEALVASTVENGDPFDGHDWDTVRVARWALRLAKERDELRRVLALTAETWKKLFDIPYPKSVDSALLAGKVVPPC